MSFIMSYQYPPPSVGGSEMDLSHPTYHSGYAVPSQSQSTSSMADPRTPNMSLHDDRDANLALRRSFSTPNAMPFPQASGGLDDPRGGSSADKKRNKLGYHRTSVACGHCRRRKIRCVPDIHDPHGRCTNCLRLKKDCNFHPVDQQTPIDSKDQLSSRTTDSQRNDSASASPATSNGHSAELSSKRPLSHQVIPPSLGHIGVLHHDDDERTSYSEASSGGRATAQPFDLAGHPQVNHWAPNDPSPASDSRQGEFPGQWPQGNTTMGDQLSPYGQMPQTSPGWHADIPGQAPPEGFPWGSMNIPARSMSYSGEGMPAHPQGHYAAAPQGQLYDRRASNFTNLYSHQIGGPLPNIPQPVMDDGRGYGTGAVTSPSPMTWNDQHVQSSSQAAYQKDEGYRAWPYGGQSHGPQ